MFFFILKIRRKPLLGYTNHWVMMSPAAKGLAIPVSLIGVVLFLVRSTNMATSRIKCWHKPALLEYLRWHSVANSSFIIRTKTNQRLLQQDMELLYKVKRSFSERKKWKHFISGWRIVLHISNIHEKSSFSFYNWRTIKNASIFFGAFFYH